MNRVLKSAEAGIAISPDFRPVRTAKVASPARDREVERLQADLAELRRKLEESEGRLESAEVARVEALEEGRLAGLEAAEGNEQARNEDLAAAARQALELVDKKLATIEPLAAMIASKCLTKLFGRDEWRGEIVAGLIAAQARKIGKRAIVRIDVSAKDFESPDAIRASLGSSVAEKVDIRLDEGLPGGGCHIALELGGVEIGLDPQWTQLEQALGEIVLSDLEPGDATR